jgi:amino acid transporter
MSTTVNIEPGLEAARQEPAGIAEKGLRRNIIGLLGGTVLGIVETAETYSIAVTLGFLVIAVGAQAPAALILGFIPIICMTVAEREFVAREPDAGTVFVWVGKALGPRLGWIASWALLVATFISLANLANVAGSYFFLMVGADGAANTQWATVLLGTSWLAVSTYLGVRGLKWSSRTQIVLLGVGLAVLALFCAVAVVKLIAGTAGHQSIALSASWLDPFKIPSSALASGLLLAIFFYWGWDGAATVAEETKGGTRTPRLSLSLAAFALLAVFVVVTIIMEAYSGVGTKGIGLANPNISNDVLAVIGDHVFGTGLGHLMKFAVMLSASACLTASVVPTARSFLSMGVYRALPEPFARVDRDTGSPAFSTIAVAVATTLILIVLSLLSSNVLSDSISAIVLLIAFYYTLTGIACVVFFRKELFRSGGDLVTKALLPAIGTGILGWALVHNLIASYKTSFGYTTILGIGGVFVIGIGSVLLGVVLMFAWSLKAPDFFRGETFTPEWAAEHAPDLT